MTHGLTVSRQVLLMRIYHLSVITHEYQAHYRIHLQVFTTCQLLLTSTISTRHQSLVSSVLLVSHELNTRVIFKFSRGMKCYSHFFVNLDVSCTNTHTYYTMVKPYISEIPRCVFMGIHHLYIWGFYIYSFLYFLFQILST